jgi:hypothetical protein
LERDLDKVAGSVEKDGGFVIFKCSGTNEVLLKRSLAPSKSKTLAGGHETQVCDGTCWQTAQIEQAATTIKTMAT